MPKVSILSATYNHEKYVAEAINSVLHQTFTDFELIMCDDASTDANVEKIETINDARLSLLLNEENCGNTATSARCWEVSSGQYIAWLLTDDVYEPHMLETLVKYLDNNPAIDGVFGLANFIDEEGHPTGEVWNNGGVGLDRYQLLRSFFYPQGYLCAPASMIRRSFIEKVGYFPRHLMQLNDLAHYVKMLFSGNLVVIDEKILNYRIRANAANVSAAKPAVSSRLAFELYEILAIFAEHIKTFHLLEKIFPEITEKKWHRDDRLTAFYLAQLALDFGHSSWHLFGLDQIYKLLSDKNMADLIKQKCGFNYPDFFRLVAEKQPIDIELPTKYAEAIEELNNARIESFQRNSQCDRVPLEGSQNVRFGSSVELISMWSFRLKLGMQYLAEWCVDATFEHETKIGVHILDSAGNILTQADHRMPPRKIGETRQLDCFVIENSKLIGAVSLGIALYDDPNETWLIDGGNCDWGNHRLLLPLETGEAFLPAARPIGLH